MHHRTSKCIRVHTRKENAKAAVVKRLVEGKDYMISSSKDEPPATAGKALEAVCRPSEGVMLTVHGFKHMCMAASTDKARRVREYYPTMEEVMLDYTRRLFEQSRAALELQRSLVVLQSAVAQEQGAVVLRQGLARVVLRVHD